jgi:hypothetical protein
MNRRHGYAAYAVVGGLAGAATMVSFHMVATPWHIVAAGVVGALIGAAVRDAL